MTERSRVLVVDDDPGMLELMEIYLSRRGFQVFGVPNGEDALGTLDDTQPDLIILDLVMPGMGGLDVLRQIKQALPRIPVVIFSGHAHTKNVVQAMRSGASDFLPKPFELEELDLALQNVLGVRGATAICPTCKGAGRV